MSRNVSRYSINQEVRDLLAGGTVVIRRILASGQYECIKDRDMSCLRHSAELSALAPQRKGEGR